MLQQVSLHELDKLQATAARAYLRQRHKHTVDWFTSKVDLNSRSCWESLEWRRQILTLLYFHHLYYFYPSLLSDFHFTKSSSSRRPSSVILPRAGPYVAKSPLFLMCIAWNKLPENIRSLASPKSLMLQFANCTVIIALQCGVYPISLPVDPGKFSF